MTDKPQVHAWFLGEDIDPADPLAAVKHRARAIDQAGEVLAEVTRTGHASVRADAIGEVAAAFGEQCLDPEAVWDASTLPDADLDSAGHIAVTLAKIEGLGHA